LVSVLLGMGQIRWEYAKSNKDFWAIASPCTWSRSTIREEGRRLHSAAGFLIAVLMDAKGLPVLHKKNEPEAVSLLRMCIYIGDMSHSSPSQYESLRVIGIASHDKSRVIVQW